MHTSLSAALNHLAAHEGGYVNHPSDPGGCTNRGITLATYRRCINPHGTCRDLRALGWCEAATIYRDHYWSAVQADALPVGLDLCVFDMGVNAGPVTAIKLLQRLLDVERDGHIGPVTLAALAAEAPERLIDGYAEARLTHYRALRHWKQFGRGWERRVAAARQAAHDLAAQKKTPDAVPLRSPT